MLSKTDSYELFQWLQKANGELRLDKSVKAIAIIAGEEMNREFSPSHISSHMKAMGLQTPKMAGHVNEAAKDRVRQLARVVRSLFIRLGIEEEDIDMLNLHSICTGVKK